MTDFVDLAPAARAVAALLPAVSEDQLGAPTPCPDMTVERLLGHLFGLAEAFRAAAGKALDPGPPPASPPPLPPDWRSALPERLDALVAAWRDPDARAGMTAVGGVELPGAVAAVVALDELVLHGWDLARATGQPYSVDGASAAACLGWVREMARPEGVPGLFGPPVPVPPDAPVLDRLLGVSGRDPRWSPAPASR